MFTKVLLSESADGLPIRVATTGTLGTPVHTALPGAPLDLVTLWATNDYTGAVALTLEWGDASSPITQTIPAKSGLYLICDDIPIQDELTVTAYAAVANAILVTGTVTRIS